MLFVLRMQESFSKGEINRFLFFFHSQSTENQDEAVFVDDNGKPFCDEHAPESTDGEGLFVWGKEGK